MSNPKVLEGLWDKIIGVQANAAAIVVRMQRHPTEARAGNNALRRLSTGWERLVALRNAAEKDVVVIQAPSQPELAELRQRVAELGRLNGESQAINAIFQLAVELVRTWPQGGGQALD